MIGGIDSTTIGLILGAMVTITISAVFPLWMFNKTTRAAAGTLAAQAAIASQERKEEAEIRRAEKREEWLRADEVARLVKENSEKIQANQIKTAKTLVDAQDLTAEKLVNSQEVTREALIASNAEVASAAREIGEKTKEKLRIIEEGQMVIHNLVNSQYTELLKAQLVTLKGSFILIKRVIKMNSAFGKPESDEDTATLSALAAQIDLLQETVNTRIEIDKASKHMASTGTTPTIPPIVKDIVIDPDATSLEEARAVVDSITEALSGLSAPPQAIPTKDLPNEGE